MTNENPLFRDCFASGARNVGVGTGLVAYYVGFSTSAFSGQGGPDELQYVPRMRRWWPSPTFGT